MKKNFKYFVFALLTTMLAVFSACKTEDPADPNAGKAKIDNLTVSPENNLKYGDVVTLSGSLSDDLGLRSYTINMSNTNGVIFEVTKMLTGKEFLLNDAITIPLPKNAVAGDMTISVTVKNSANAIISKEILIKNLGLPVFDQLFLAIKNIVYPMKKDGNFFEVEDFIPASSVGKIYTKADKTGMSWGLEGTAIQPLGSGDIKIGKETEEYFKISFNPVSFELSLGEIQPWTPITESLYILGNISGHWADGEIKVEKTKMKMNGFSLGSKKMWTWTAPNTGTGDPIDDMWGEIIAGTLRFKKAGLEQYIVYSGGQIATGADNKDASFVLTDGGPYTIKVFADATSVLKVKMDDGTKTLEYTNQGILINGTLAVSTISFANSTLNLVPGNYFLYEGTFNFTKNQTITAQGVNLATAFCDPDVFTGKGNATWTCIQETGQYYVRIDAFSGNVYVRKESGYPDVIYMDGWCWGKHEADPRNPWEATSRLSLYRKGTTNLYEATFYLLPWGGDVSFSAAPPTNVDVSKMGIGSKYFDGVTIIGNGMTLPVPTASAFYKVSVDLKDGFTFDKVNLDGTNYTIVPTNGKKFTIAFTAL